MFLIRLMTFPFRASARATGLAVRTVNRTGRLLGYRRLAVLGTGVGVGLLLAPTSGRRLRQGLRAAVETRFRRLPDEELAERVRFELNHSPRTWHLPQPAVEARGGTVVLRGDVPHETGRDDFERTAASVPGVAAVDNQVAVRGTGARAQTS
ncbi:hypothetical protein BH18ACT4_BH18ACT4_07870 [soil metagenome]